MSKRIIAGALAGAVLASTMAPMGVYADSPEVNIWVSKVNATDSGMEKGLEKQTPVHFGSGDSASTNNLIVVDENNTYQTVDGFGASITEASAHLYQTNLDDSAKAAAMQALFDKESGIGLSMLRQTIGASDHCVAPYNFAPDEQDDSLPLLTLRKTAMQQVVVSTLSIIRRTPMMHTLGRRFIICPMVHTL